MSSFIACVQKTGYISTVENVGVISLTYTRNEEYLLIEIFDNGKGFEGLRLEELR